MLGECGRSTEEEIKSVLEQDWKCWDWRVGYGGWREGFDVRPGEVDIEEKEKGAETSNGGLECKLLVILDQKLSEVNVHQAHHRRERVG